MDTINQVTDETACIDVDSLYWSTVLEYSDYRYNGQRILKVQFISYTQCIVVLLDKQLQLSWKTPIQHKDYANWLNKK